MLAEAKIDKSCVTKTITHRPNPNEVLTLILKSLGPIIYCMTLGLLICLIQSSHIHYSYYQYAFDGAC